MATAQFVPMGHTPNPFKSDLDIETFFDFSQGTEPSQRAESRVSSQAGPCNQNAPYDDPDDRQVFAGPSHEYDRFRQQTGIPVGDVANLSHLNQPMSTAFGGFNSGIDDMALSNGFNDSWSTGLDVDADMTMDFPSMPAMFLPSSAPPASASQDFVDPNSIDGGEEPASNVGRLWPGMHQQQAQQAAMAKRAQMQRQHQMQQQQTRPQSNAAGKQRFEAHHTDAQTEESISRLLNRMRQASHAPSLSEDDMQNGFLPNIARMKKDEEEMDEDERLLASEEGKKLSSKERRQLRNKVSARAFRSRRKEYIGQLEGEVAVKVQEAGQLKTENQALVEENARYRALIQTLLRHPSFTPFIEDFSKDPAFIESQTQQSRQPQQQQQQQQPQQQASAAPSPAPSAHQQQAQQQNHQQQAQSQRRPSHMSGQHLQIPKQEAQHVGMTMIPEAPVDLSMLHLSNNRGRPQQNMNFNFQQPQIYQAQNVPQGPSPLDIALDAVKTSRQDNDDYLSFNGMNW